MSSRLSGSNAPKLQIMIGILVELVISWLLLWFFCKKNLTALGFVPSKSRVWDCVFGFLFAALGCTLYHVSSAFFADNFWVPNVPFSASLFGAGLWFTVKSVLFEELIFRGALLYILIQKLGVNKACILSAIGFGVYHWFSFGAFGNAANMAIIFVITGIQGLAFAYAFAKTTSLYLPIALHLGWNLFNIVIFSNGPLKQQLFILQNANKPEGIISLVLFLFQIFALPLVVFGYLKWRKKISTY